GRYDPGLVGAAMAGGSRRRAGQRFYRYELVIAHRRSAAAAEWPGVGSRAAPDPRSRRAVVARVEVAMDPTLLPLPILVLLFALLTAGMPIGFAMGLSAFVGTLLLIDLQPALALLGQT